MVTLSLKGSGFNTQKNLSFFSGLTHKVASRASHNKLYLPESSASLFASCPLLLVEWMSSLLTAEWAMHGLLMLKFSWHHNKHPNAGGTRLQMEISDRRLFFSRLEWQFATYIKGKLNCKQALYHFAALSHCLWAWTSVVLSKDKTWMEAHCVVS